MAKKRRTPKKLPIEYWSHSSLMGFLRNPLTWYKRYVERVYDTPSTPASIIGRAGHLALEHYYGGIDKESATAAGLRYLKDVPDFEINFGVAKSVKAKREKRKAMERDYLQAVGFYLARPPRHKVVGAEVKGVARVPGLKLPVKAVSDLVVESRVTPGALDIVDHKFVDSFSKSGAARPAFALQAIFNYYTVRERYERPVSRFIVYECKKRRNADGRPQLRRYVINYAEAADAFSLFHRLLADATKEISRDRLYLPNPSDMFEGEHSVDIYHLRLLED